jgi:hypothetical protein
MQNRQKPAKKIAASIPHRGGRRQQQQRTILALFYFVAGLLSGLLRLLKVMI